jgi:hypothetical protein
MENFNAQELQQKIFAMNHQNIVQTFAGRNVPQEAYEVAETMAKRVTVRLFELASDEELMAYANLLELTEHPHVKSLTQKMLSMVMDEITKMAGGL